MSRPTLKDIASRAGVSISTVSYALNDKSTLPLALTFFNSTHATRYDLMMAAATMAVVPVLIVFLIFQRHIVKALVLAGMR